MRSKRWLRSSLAADWVWRMVVSREMEGSKGIKDDHDVVSTLSVLKAPQRSGYEHVVSSPCPEYPSRYVWVLGKRHGICTHGE